jgi:hypothetical protein
MRVGFAQMSRLRCKLLFGCYLAFAGLALQLILSFGHVHLEGIRAGSLAAAAAFKGPASQPSPAQHPANDADDYCAICATIHLAASSFLPDAPQLPVPFVSQAVELSSHVGFVFVAPQRTAFQSRAPPLA